MNQEKLVLRVLGMFLNSTSGFESINNLNNTILAKKFNTKILHAKSLFIVQEKLDELNKILNKNRETPNLCEFLHRIIGCFILMGRLR